MTTSAAGIRSSLFAVAAAFNSIAILSPVANGQTRTAEDSFVDWARETAVHLDTLDWQEVDTSDLSFLARALQGKRVVFLGEGDHWIHEKYDYRLIVIRYLFERGWRHIGMEMGLSDGKRVDRYLQTGDAAHLDRVAIYGYKADLREDRDDHPRGLPALENPEFLRRFVAEERWFLKQLRHLNESLPSPQPRLRWFGFDVDFLPGGGYADARDLLVPHKDDPVVDEILRRLTPLKGESRPAEAQRLTELVAFIERREQKVRETLGPAETEDLKRTLRCLADSFEFVEASQNGVLAPEWIAGLRKREQRMARRMDDALAKLSPGDKLILMGHNLHMSKDSTAISFQPVGNPPFPMWPSIGTHVANKLPGQVYSVWMLCDHGRHGQVVRAEGGEELPSNPLAMEHLLAKAGATFFLPLHSTDPRGSYLDQQRNFLQNGQLASGVVTQQADAIFFVAKVSEFRQR